MDPDTRAFYKGVNAGGAAQRGKKELADPTTDPGLKARLEEAGITSPTHIATAHRGFLAAAHRTWQMEFGGDVRGFD